MLTRTTESRRVWGGEGGGEGGAGRELESMLMCVPEIKKTMFQFVMWIISKLYVSVGGLLFF